LLDRARGTSRLHRISASLSFVVVIRPRRRRAL
jgi:hypothetical protein